MKFYELAIGAVFEFRGRRYTKIAMSMTEDENRTGTIFMGGAEVAVEVASVECGMANGVLLPAEVAARWKPDLGHWAHVFDPAQEEEGA